MTSKSHGGKDGPPFPKYKRVRDAREAEAKVVFCEEEKVGSSKGTATPRKSRGNTVCHFGWVPIRIARSLNLSREKLLAALRVSEGELTPPTSHPHLDELVISLV